MITRNQSPLSPAVTYWPGLMSVMPGRKPTVLLAEDDPGVSAIICALLKAHDFEVKATDSGLEALLLARSLAPDVVVLDINLPEMSGLEVCRELKAHSKTREMPVVFCSGEEHLSTEALAAGGAAFLEKPGGVLKLAEFLRELIGVRPRIDLRNR